MERMRIGIVGLNFGRHIVESEIVAGAGAPFFELAAVCDMDAEKAKALGSKHRVTAYTALEELLCDDSIRVIGLFTGPVGRANLIRQIIRAGRDVMTTKPFELDPDAGQAVLEEAQSLGRVVHLNSPSPLFTGDLQQIDRWVRDFGLGRPIACRADVWVSYREKADGNWYDDPDLCPAAPIFRLGIYPINDMMRFLGPADEVLLTQSRLFTGRPTADNAQLSVLFRSGAIGNVFASFCVKDGEFYKNSLVLNFENGTIYRNQGPMDAMSPGMCKLELVAGGPDGKVVEHAKVHGHSGEYQWGVFRRAVGGERSPDEIKPAQVVEGIRVIRAMTRAQHSRRAEKV